MDKSSAGAVVALAMALDKKTEFLRHCGAIRNLLVEQPKSSDMEAAIGGLDLVQRIVELVETKDRDYFDRFYRDKERNP